MPKPPLPDEVSDLLAKPNPSVITTLRPDGHPVSVATWYLWEDGRVLVNMDEGRRRLDYLRSDPRVTLTALDESTWYTHVSLQGRVDQMYDDSDLTDIDGCPRTTPAGPTPRATAGGSAPGSRSRPGTAGAPPRPAELPRDRAAARGAYRAVRR